MCTVAFNRISFYGKIYPILTFFVPFMKKIIWTLSPEGEFRISCRIVRYVCVSLMISLICL